MNCAVFTSADAARRQTAGTVAVTNWFFTNTAFKGFSKQWRAIVGSLALPSLHPGEHPTPTGEGRP